MFRQPIFNGAGGAKKKVESTTFRKEVNVFFSLCIWNNSTLNTLPKRTVNIRKCVYCRAMHRHVSEQICNANEIFVFIILKLDILWC